MLKNKRIIPLLILGILELSFIILYYQALWIQSYGDDFKYLIGDMEIHPFSLFLTSDTNGTSYRPIQAVIHFLLQRTFGLFNPLPVHIVHVAVFSMFCGLFYFAIVKIFKEQVPALIATGILMFSQLQVMLIAGMDTLSALLSLTFGYFSLWYAWRALQVLADGQSSPVRYWFASTFCYILAIFSKETGISFLFLNSYLIVLFVISKKKSFSQVCLHLIFLVIVTAAFMGLMHYMDTRQVSCGNDRYAFSFGLAVFRNLFYVVTALFSPTATVRIYEWYSCGKFMPVILSFSGVLMIIVLLIKSWISSREKMLLVHCGSMVLLSLMPVLFINHISELYIVNALPVFAVLTGKLLYQLFSVRLLKKVRYRVVTVSFLVLFCVGTIEGICYKMALMVKNGERATAMYWSMRDCIKDVPPQSVVLLVYPESEFKYSVFHLDALGYFRYSFTNLKRLYRRSDLTIVEMPERLFIKTPIPADLILDCMPGLIKIRDLTPNSAQQ